MTIGNGRVPGGGTTIRGERDDLPLVPGFLSRRRARGDKNRVGKQAVTDTMTVILSSCDTTRTSYIISKLQNFGFRRDNNPLVEISD